MTNKKYDPRKEVMKNISLTIGTGVGLGVSGKIASGVDTATGTTTASSMFAQTAPIIGVVPLVHTGKTLIGSMSMLDVDKKKKK